MVELKSDEISDLRLARQLLENPGLAMKLTSVLGSSLEKGFALLPPGWHEAVAALSRRALEAAVRSAVLSMKADRQRCQAANTLHRLMVAGTGAVGGFWGMPALAVELPLATTIMLRSIADIARSEGHLITDPEIMVACIEVFAFGGPGKSDNGADTGYFAVRAGLARAVSDAASHIAGKGLSKTVPPVMVRLLSQVGARFGVQVSEKIAAQALPVIGALGGAVINTLFIDHFQAMARGHFILLRLERTYGPDLIRDTYLRV
jgi:hypothetical protein